MSHSITRTPRVDLDINSYEMKFGGLFGMGWFLPTTTS